MARADLESKVAVHRRPEGVAWRVCALRAVEPFFFLMIKLLCYLPMADTCLHVKCWGAVLRPAVEASTSVLGYGVARFQPEFDASSIRVYPRRE